jgi:hypothetical protein
VTGHSDSLSPEGRGAFPAWLHWARDFPGDPKQVPRARHWVKAILPACPQLDDVAEIGSELVTNAITHTDSCRRFDIELAWSMKLLRVVGGDQGGPSFPRLIEEAGGICGRGLLIVDRLSHTWGVAGDPAGRWVWADVPWPAGPPALVPEDNSGVEGGLARLRRAYPGVPHWYGQATSDWWAALPERGDADELTSAPYPFVLSRMLARRPPVPSRARITSRQMPVRRRMSLVITPPRQQG